MQAVRPTPDEATPRAWLRCLRAVFALALLLVVALPAQAASYVFPTAMPPGCSGSNGIYTCTGGGALGSSDTVTINGTKPATITISGDINVNGAKINQTGAASDLTIVVNGIFNPGYQGVANANVRAYSVSDGSGQASIGGTLQATSGNIALGYRTVVTGNITGSANVTLGDEAQASGSITASGTVTTGYRSIVGGSINAGGTITLGQETDVGGSATSTGSNTDVSIGYAARVRGAVRADNGQVSLAQNAQADACVQTAQSSKAIILGWSARAGSVCCGALGSCSSNCVQNNSGSSMPSMCSGSSSATLLAKYVFEEPAYNGSAGELKDSAGHASGPFHGRSEGSPLPTADNAAPARGGSTGTCGYATLPGSADTGGRFVIDNLPVSTTAGAKTTVAFWMYWNGTDAVLPVGWNVYNLSINASHFGFNTGNSDIYGMASSGLANGWNHVVAVFTNGGVTGNKLYVNNSLQTLTQRVGSPDAAYAVASSSLYVGGQGALTTNRMVGRVDELHVYNGEITAAQVSTLFNATHACSAALVARYDFNETAYTGAAGEWKDTAALGIGPFDGRGQGSAMPVTASANPARGGSPGTCSYASLAGPSANGPSLVATGLPTTTTTGATTTVAFWMNWSGSNDGIVVSFGEYDLWFASGHFGFNTDSSDIWGISSSGMAGVWKHVVAVFVNGSVTSSQLYIDGTLQTLTQRMGTPNAARAVTTTTLQVSGYTADTNHRFSGLVDSLRIYNGAPSAAQIASLVAETPSTCVPPLHHLEIQHGSGSGLTCTPSTLTIRACQDAACATPYTGGVSGSFSATGGRVSWPDGAGFTIAAGSSSTTERVQVSTTTATVLGATGSSPVPSSATTCNFGSPACTFTAADSGFLFDVPNHVSEVLQTVSVSAVRKSDNSTSCTPAFASTSKTVTFTCGYANPSSGTLPVRVGGTALNASASSGAACDAVGRGVSLAFNASGVASTTVQYADVGQVTLNASYTGSAGSGDAGLVMTGTDRFIAAPDSFTVSGVTSGPIRAGGSFGATVSARNSAGNTTPNHGRESSPEGVTLAWVRLQPTGSGAVDGSFSGSLGSFSGGAASSTSLAWTEVGRGDLLARSSSASGYLGSGVRAFGSSLASGARRCATEGGNCVLPGGTTATVYYGENGSYAVKPAQTGTVACTNGNFGDPLRGTVKQCFYAVSSASNGSVGNFIPDRFTVAATHACASFSYAGQPIATTVTARNAAGNTTLNFNGSATTTPVFAQAVTLSEPAALGLGTLAGNSIAASAFAAGVATATPSYAFTQKATAPQTLVLRASNNASGSALISSQGDAEPSLPLRSGRLRLSNAYGKATAALQLAAVTEYWAGNSWLLNSADSCTAVAGASMALSNPRTATGAASTATSSAGALAISNGSGSITLAAPSPAGSSLSLDLAVNLGSTAADQSCLGAHPATIGAAKPWLRAQIGSCVGTADRDPAARASFGIASPETKKTIHVREVF